MPDDANGGHSLPASYFVQDGDTVMPEQHNPPLEDVSDALTNRLHRDGRTIWTGSQNANGNKITNLANGVALGDAANVGQAVAASTPIGSVVPYAGVTAPPNWMFAYGQAISRTTYSACYAALGGAASPWGQGDGSTTFNVPDCRDFAIIGKGDMGGTPANRITNAAVGLNTSNLAATGGSQTHTLTTPQIPAHNHGASTSSDGNHAHSGSTAGAGAHSHSGATDVQGAHAHGGSTSVNGSHTHGYTAPNALLQTAQLGSGYPNISGAAANTGAAGDHNHSITTDVQGAHQHGLAINGVGDHAHSLSINAAGAHTHVVTVNNTGGGEAHPNVQPSVVMNYIIRVA